MATKLTKAELTALAEKHDVDISGAKTNADIEQALKDAGVETAADRSEQRDAALPSAELQDEARELGIEPSGYHTEQELQERVDHVRAEKEAVGGDTTRPTDGSNDNLNTASDEDASRTQANQ